MLQPVTRALPDHASSYKVLPADLTPLAESLGGMARAIEFKRQMHEQASSYGCSPDPLDWELRVFGNGALLLALPNDWGAIQVRTSFGRIDHHTPESLSYGLNLVVTDSLMRALGDAERASLWAFRAAIVDCITGMTRLSAAPERSTPAPWFGHDADVRLANSCLPGHPRAREILNLAGCAVAI